MNFIQIFINNYWYLYDKKKSLQNLYLLKHIFFQLIILIIIIIILNQKNIGILYNDYILLLI